MSVRKGKKTKTVVADVIEVEVPYRSFDPNQFNLFPNYNPHLENTPAPRPTFYTIDKTELYNGIAEELIVAFADGSEVEDIIDDVKDVFARQSAFSEDGYELAKEFDDKGYSVDSQTVEILSGVWFNYEEVQKKANRIWVQTYDIKPMFKEGDIIKSKSGKIGKLKKYYDDEAKVGIEATETSVYIFNQEDCTLIP